MSQRKKPSPPPTKLVWRVSQAAPLGEFVDPSAPPPVLPGNDLPEATAGGGWVVSSFELLHGADVTEGPDTVPADLFDELFPASGAGREATSR
jgi:hypothetical protein